MKNGLKFALKTTFLTLILFCLLACTNKEVSEPQDMVWIPGGTFLMGSEDHLPHEGPVHEVELDGFWIDKYEVTNEEFAKFVKETGYITIAEKNPDPKDFPGVEEEKLVSGSLVFTPPSHEVSLDDPLQWWQYKAGANWRQPDGPGSSIEGKENHPVVHVAWADAKAYANWAGKTLPTEAQWEYVAKTGLDEENLHGNFNKKDSKLNSFQGKFPHHNTLEDGYETTAPVGSFPANKYGVYDLLGNVWEWTNDFYRPDYYTKSPRKNPSGPNSSFDPQEPNLVKKVTRGGSFLCSVDYCQSYRPTARMASEIDTSTNHIGFRCVKSK